MATCIYIYIYDYIYIYIIYIERGCTHEVSPILVQALVSHHRLCNVISLRISHDIPVKHLVLDFWSQSFEGQIPHSPTYIIPGQHFEYFGLNFNPEV